MQFYGTQHHEDQIYSSFVEGMGYWIQTLGKKFAQVDIDVACKVQEESWK
jgi:hypothetical protein